jgi:hypothetical protein
MYDIIEGTSHIQIDTLIQTSNFPSSSNYWVKHINAHIFSLKYYLRSNEQAYNFSERPNNVKFDKVFRINQ